MISIRNVTKAFGGKPALHGVSFEVRPGEIFGLLGHNGAGKSTTLGILLGQVFPDSGEAFINGYSVHKQRHEALASTGAIFEAPRFYDYLSGWRNLEIYSSYSARVSPKRIQEAVNIAGLGNRIHDRVGTYSQGMRQRLGLAQALLPDNQLILLDEPTNGLDPEGIHEMRGLIQHLNREHGLTVVFCSHLLAEVEQLCSHVVILNQGRKVFDGQWADLSGTTSELRLDAQPWADAERLLLQLPGIDILGPGHVSLAGETSAPDMVAHLVRGGIRLSAVEPQRRGLEAIYLSLTQSATQPHS